MEDPAGEGAAECARGPGWPQTAISESHATSAAPTCDA